MKKVMLHGIGVVLFIFIFMRIDFRVLGELLIQARIELIILSLLLHFLIILVKAYKWKYIMKCQGIMYNLWDLCIMYASGMYFGLVTPGRVGEFARALYLKQDHSFGKSFASVFFDRLTDFLMLSFIAYLGVVYFLGVFTDVFAVITLILITGVLIGVLFVMKKGMLVSFLSWVFRHILPAKYQDKARSNLSDFLQGIFCLNLRNVAFIGFLTVVSWLLYLYQVYLMSVGLSLPISFFFVSFCVAIAGFVSLLPITVFGIGTRDAAFIFLFALRGFSKESAVALSGLMLLILFFSAGIGLFAWFKKPIRIGIKKV